MNAKNILKSKTFWLNLLGGVLFLYQGYDPAHALITNAHLGPAMAALNLFMRYVTTQPVTLLASK